jgi:hypothetical protein
MCTVVHTVSSGGGRCLYGTGRKAALSPPQTFREFSSDGFRVDVNLKYDEYRDSSVLVAGLEYNDNTLEVD